jgi:hypothetical protein
MVSALVLTSGTSPGVPWQPFKHRGQPFTDSDERRSALACAAQDERPFEASDDHFSEGPPDLRLAYACVRLNDPEAGASMEMVRVAESLEGPPRARQISEAIDSSLGDVPLTWPSRARVFTGDVDLSVVSTRLGLQACSSH